MIRYILARLTIVAVSVLGLITLTFLLVSLIPGDPAEVMLGYYATPSSIATVHHQLGLDTPLPQRFVEYVGNVLHGDLGTSYFTKRPVMGDLLSRVPNTLVIVIPGMILAIVFGSVLGSLGAYYRRRMPDRLVGVWITGSQAVPEFVIALALIYLFFFVFGIAPAPLGMTDATVAPVDHITGFMPLDAVLSGNWRVFWDVVTHAILPAVTLGITGAMFFAKTVRTGLAQSLRSSQVEFARACGIRERKVFRYALTAVRTSLLTYVVILWGSCLAGMAVIEVVFAWPGVGNWSLQGVLKSDLPVIQGFVLLLGVGTLLAYVLLDVVVAILDPRARPGSSSRKRRKLAAAQTVAAAREAATRLPLT